MYKTLRKITSFENWGVKQWLSLSCAFSCALVMARIAVTGQLTFLFLIWNLFLAFIPFAISEWLFNRFQLTANRWVLAAASVMWILFIPNSFYILTDLFHLYDFDNAPRWFDLLLIFSFSWNGLLLGLLSVRKMELMLQRASGRPFSLLMVFAVMWLNAFGVYIGRYLRFNSWDVLTRPFSLFSDLLQILIHPFRNKMEWGMIGVYAVFMTVLYFTIKKMASQFHATEKQ